MPEAYLPESVFLKNVACNVECQLLDEYNVSLAHIQIFKCNSRIIYCVDEPPIDDSVKNIVLSIVKYASITGLKRLPSSAPELRKIALKAGIPPVKLADAYPIVKYYVERVLSGYGPLYPLLRDPDVEEIAVDGPRRSVSILHRRVAYGWIDTNIVLTDNELDTLVLYLARRIGKPVSIAHPYAEGLTPEGHRVALTYLKEVSRHGSSIVVRKHFEKPMSMTQLIDEGMLNELIAAYLWVMLEYGASVLIVGPTAAGKTTLLQALLGLIPSTKRVVTIEDTPELNLLDRPHWDSLVTRRSYSKDIEDVDLAKLAVFALRRRPDILVIGEIRGVEAKVFLQAAATGHGAAATFHADSPQSAIDRLRSMHVEDYLLQNLWVIVVVKRVQRPGLYLRRVTTVTEYCKDGLRPLFRWDARRDEHEPQDLEEVAKNSCRLPHLAEQSGQTLTAILEEIETRADMLRRLRERGVYEFKDLYSEIDEAFSSKTLGLLYAKAHTPPGE